MRELLAAADGVRLLGADYWRDFDENFWSTGPSGFWKVERLQRFREPGDESWVAFAGGDWEKALALLQARRPSLAGYRDRLRAQGFENRRVRVVEPPLNAYLQWELHLLLLRDEYGARTRVLDAEHVRPLESDGVLPELVVLGDEVVYELLYDQDGLQEGGIRFTRPELVARARELVAGLYARAEDITAYFQREVAVLEPPVRSG
ncbi:DUF6879 family protein [Actinokineospora sp. NBRC 105648]|uniref:DUF6879 family protein n=1 Tax=Actinokineospora sp. NBRC 105648 TaxID=3032206 RepID=UPI0024A4EDD1|nr:DUF6879 family protein [Actinokineospora sp. NBRC 105648]GLZ39021.1 hypothetical protein Acsp05_26450 [Actinokineospora sp. NBRC 105648]